MTGKIKLIFVLAFFALLIAACNLPMGPDSQTEGTDALLVTDEPSAAETTLVDPLLVEVPPPANTDGAETVFVPGALFWMGSPDTDEAANMDEMPYHQVTQSGFYIYTHEVTNAMYLACVEARACLPVRVFESGPTTHYGDPEYAEYPVVGVDWLMAEDYCTWANGRLPTEAEWELASRGAESLAYPWGDELATCDRVNMLGCEIPSDVVEVGSYLLGNSPYEAWDLSGNVWEWVNDWYDEDYYALSAAINPVGPYYSELKVARGGGLYSDAKKMRSAERAGVDPHRAYDDVGFRCVPTATQLPEDFLAPEEEHIWSTPDPLEGGGDRLDDPGGEPGVPPEEPDDTPWARMGFSGVSCPDAEGMMRLYAEIDTSDPDQTYEMTVEGNPFDCTYNEGLRALECVGPIPENNDELTEYHVEVYVPGFGIAHFYPVRPLDCPAEMHTPDMAELSESCAEEDGFVNLYFHYEPAITWTSVTNFETGEEVPCVMDSPNSSTCTLPMNADGDYYLSWRGNYDDGTAIFSMTYFHIAEDCGGTSQTIDPFCFEGHPMVQVMYLPVDRPLGEVTQADHLLDCIGMAPGVQVCGNLIGDPGSVADISYCFEDGECYSGAVLVPGCVAGLIPGMSYSITPTCYEGLGPVVVINYSPADLLMVAANANGADLTCYDAPEPGYYMCTGLPGEVDDFLIMTITFSDGSTINDEIIYPDCEEESEPAGFWNLLDVNCFHESDIYMIIDTPMSELVSGVEFNYTVQTADGETSYTCELHPDIAGRIFCWGEPPAHDNPLSVCVSTPGVEEECTSFDDFWVRVPLCPAPVETEEPTDEPEEPTEEPTEPPLPDCSTYTNPGTCWADSRCRWVQSMTHVGGGYCRTR